MAVHAPTKDELKATAAHYCIAFSDTELEEYQAAIAARLSSYDAVARMPDEVPEVRYPRTPGRRALPEENPHNAWYWKTCVKGADSGKLRGKTVSLKDNVMLAGVPMMNGTPQLEGYVPEFDAPIVTRILDAGGEILGKAHCELLCMTGSSFTNTTGPVHNPWRHGYSAGGLPISVDQPLDLNGAVDVRRAPLVTGAAE